jgi:hypothetical protein
MSLPVSGPELLVRDRFSDSDHASNLLLIIAPADGRNAQAALCGSALGLSMIPEKPAP